MDKRPNMIFFFSDQQRWDTVGCYGQKFNVTPNLDKWLNMHSHASMRAVLQGHVSKPLEGKTISKHFSKSGYRTGYVGKWHLASDTKAGFDYRTKTILQERRGGYRYHWIASDILEPTSQGYSRYLFDADMKKVHFRDLELIL